MAWPIMRVPKRDCCVAKARRNSERLLGYTAESEMVHRDNMVVTGSLRQWFNASSALSRPVAWLKSFRFLGTQHSARLVGQVGSSPPAAAPAPAAAGRSQCARAASRSLRLLRAVLLTMALLPLRR